MRRHPISSLNLSFFIIITELELLPVLVPSKEAEVVWVILEELPKPQPLMELTDQDSLLLPALTLAPMIRHNNNNKHPSATGRKKNYINSPHFVWKGFVIMCNKRSATQLLQHFWRRMNDDRKNDMNEKIYYYKKLKRMFIWEIMNFFLSCDTHY